MAERRKNDVTQDMLAAWARGTRAAMAPFLQREQEAAEAEQKRSEASRPNVMTADD
ncbi:hypothetical protein [Sphaerisporangium dianthi]|uniref:Uncharacterized protein n=1 Tax=Sphaerisporangium dianthi TaxID=1436120 RepID=A0ABV9CCU8_9ACTN